MHTRSPKCWDSSKGFEAFAKWHGHQYARFDDIFNKHEIIVAQFIGMVQSSSCFSRKFGDQFLDQTCTSTNMAHTFYTSSIQNLFQSRENLRYAISVCVWEREQYSSWCDCSMFFVVVVDWELVQFKQLVWSILHFCTLSWCGCLLYWTLFVFISNIVFDIHVPYFYAMNLRICAL